MFLIKFNFLYGNAWFIKKNIKHKVLNAKNHALEAEIIASAGCKNSVTIATNMAGRGTDIILGGNLDAKILVATKDIENCYRCSRTSNSAMDPVHIWS